jgi:hypothetical protein
MCTDFFLSCNWFQIVCFGVFLLKNCRSWPWYIVVKYKIHLYSLQNRPEKLAKGSLFCLFLKLVQINFIFTVNVRILYIYQVIGPSYILSLSLIKLPYKTNFSDFENLKKYCFLSSSIQLLETSKQKSYGLHYMFKIHAIFYLSNICPMCSSLYINGTMMGVKFGLVFLVIDFTNLRSFSIL